MQKKNLNLNFCLRKRIKKTYLRCIPLCFGVCLLFHWIFRLNCRTTVTPFIRRCLLCFCIFSSYKVFYVPWSPVMRHQCVHYKVHMSPMACKLLYTLFLLWWVWVACGCFWWSWVFMQWRFFVSLWREMMLNILFCHAKKNEALGYKQVPQNDEKPVYMIQQGKLELRFFSPITYCLTSLKNWKWCTGKNNGFPFLDILGYLKYTYKNPKFGKWDKSQPGNFQPSSLVGTCLTLPTLGFLWVFFKYAKISKNGNLLFFPVMEIKMKRICIYSLSYFFLQLTLFLTCLIFLKGNYYNSLASTCYV